MGCGVGWLENAYKRAFSGGGAIATSTLGQTELVFDMRIGFISRYVHARLQVSVCGATVRATSISVTLSTKSTVSELAV